MNGEYGQSLYKRLTKVIDEYQEEYKDQLIGECEILAALDVCYTDTLIKIPDDKRYGHLKVSITNIRTAIEQE